MRGIGRAALVVAILVAGFFVLLEAQPSNRLTQKLADGAERVAHVAERVVDRVVDKLSDRVENGEAARNAAQSPQQPDDFVWRGRVDADDVLEIKGVNGPVIAELASGSEIEVRAEKRARRSDPSRVRIEVVEHAGGVTLCAVYPSRDRRENYCGPGNEGRNSVNDNDVKVTFYVKVPAGVEFHGRTVNGSVDIDGLESDVIASSVNGDVEVSTTGFAEARTVNGSIDAIMGTINPDGMRFSTVNGSIDLDLPDDLDADIDASWLNGRLDTDIPVELQGRISRRSAEGRFGRGGPEIKLNTVNGSIRIR